MKHVIFITSYAGQFNGRDYKERGGIYGSELACISIATQLSKWYTVTVFVNDDVDLVEDNVRYIRWSNYEMVCRDIPPDICVISRYINFFIYNTNYAKQTYLWVHDVCPQSSYEGRILINNGISLLNNILPLLDKIICVGKTQMQEIFIEKLKIPPTKLCYIPNGIHTDENHSIEKIINKKIENSFIFCSSPDRHLNILLKLFPKITNLLKNATLDIYYSDVPEECKQLMQDQKNVKCHGKVSYEQLQKIMQQAEYWIYPTKFFETCCTIAFETAYNGCIQITSHVGALKENVKGICIQHDSSTLEFENELLKTLQEMTPQRKKEIIYKQYNWTKEQTWNSRGIVWKNLFEKNDASYIVPNSTREHVTFPPLHYVVFPYYYRHYYKNGFGNKDQFTVHKECQWIDEMKKFIESTDEYLCLECNMINDMIDNIKCYFVAQNDKNEIRKKFSLTDITQSSVILHQAGVQPILDKIHKNGINGTPLTHLIYDSLIDSRRLIYCKNKNKQNETVKLLNASLPPFTIGCAIMVKNESKNIEKTLNSIENWVHCLVIYDTGSEDDTISVIQKWCESKKMPLYIKTGQFVDFSISRNTLLKFADDKADYLLLLDASDELQNGELIYYTIIENPDKLMLRVTQRWIADSTLEFQNIRVIKTKHKIFYDYPVHEALNGQPEHVVDMKKVVIQQYRLDDIGKSKRRWLRDKDVLLKERIKRKNDGRVVFYLAQTYKCLCINESAVATYKQRIELGGYRDEVEESYIAIYECYIRDTRIMKKEEIINMMKELWNIYSRIEGAYYCGALLADSDNNYVDAHEWAVKACEGQYPTTRLWINQNLCNYYRWQLLAVTSLHTHNYDVGFEALKKIITSNDKNVNNILKEYNKFGYCL